MPSLPLVTSQASLLMRQYRPLISFAAPAPWRLVNRYLEKEYQISAIDACRRRIAIYWESFYPTDSCWRENSNCDVDDRILRSTILCCSFAPSHTGMKIVAIDLFYISLPVIREIADGSQDSLLCRVTADDGLEARRRIFEGIFSFNFCRRRAGERLILLLWCRSPSM